MQRTLQILAHFYVYDALLSKYFVVVAVVVFNETAMCLTIQSCRLKPIWIELNLEAPHIYPIWIRFAYPVTTFLVSLHSRTLRWISTSGSTGRMIGSHSSVSTASKSCLSVQNIYATCGYRIRSSPMKRRPTSILSPRLTSSYESAGTEKSPAVWGKPVAIVVSLILCCVCFNPALRASTTGLPSQLHAPWI